MAIQPFALQAQAQPVDGIGAFARGAQAASQTNGMNLDQARKGMEMIGSIALGSMGGNLDGEVDPQKYEQGLNLLAQQGVNVDPLRGKPEMAKVAARASMSALQQMQTAQGEKNYQLAMQQFQHTLQTGLAESASMTPVFMRDASGNEQIGQMLSGGGIMVNGEKFPGVPDGWSLSARPQGVGTVDQGNQVTLIDKTTGKSVGEPIVKDNYTPAFDSSKGGVEGKFAGEKPLLASKAQAALSTFERGQKVVADNVDKAISQINSNPNIMAGFAGDMLSGVKGTPQYDLSQTLQTIKANIGFDKLQEMRNNSPTGGALGQVSEKENLLLQAVNGALEQGQSAQQLMENLNRIKELQKEVAADRRAAFGRDFGNQQQTQQPSTSGDVIDWSEL